MVIIHSLITLSPGKVLILHISESCSGAYEADPIDVRTIGFVASDGTGISIWTFVALLYSKLLFESEFSKSWIHFHGITNTFVP